MTKITGGLVSIEDGVKKGEEYAPPRKVRVELRFDVLPDEDDQARLMEVSRMAHEQVKVLLGQKPTMEAAYQAVADLVDAAPAPATRKPRAKKTEAAPAETFPGASDGAEAKPEGKTSGSVEAASGVPNDTVQPGAEAPAEVISDKKLFDTVVEINAKIKQGKAITAIINKYCPQDGVPPSLKRIPEAKRPAFLQEVRTFADNATEIPA